MNSVQRYPAVTIPIKNFIINIKSLDRMAHLEKYQRQINRVLSEEEIKAKLETVKQQICREWELYKMHHSLMHGIDVGDKGIDKVLCFFIRRRVL